MGIKLKIAKLLNRSAGLLGFHLFKKNYNLPVPQDSDMQYCRNSELTGIDICDEVVLYFLKSVIIKYKEEFAAFPVDFTPNAYYLLNNSFMAVDGNVYYSLVRELKPKRIIEIGSGFSTALAVEAIKKNGPDNKTRLTSIEPYPSEMLLNLKEDINLVKKPVQEIDMDVFTSLEEGDILFVDSSHALKSGGDVWYEYCEIFPRLKPGVYVHIHDISLPKPYPNVYYDSMLYWNEQYLLQAYLTNNSKVEIIWPGNYMMTKYPEKMTEYFAPEYKLMKDKFKDSEPSSFWMQVK